MSFFNRFQGTFFSPDLTFKAVASKPVWVDVVIVVILGMLLFTYLSAPYLQQDQIQFMESNTRLLDRLGEDQFNQMLDSMRNPAQWRIITGYIMAAIGLLAGLLISSLVILVLGRMGSTEGRYIQVFAVVAHAHLIDKILGNAVRTFLVLSQKSFYQATTSLAVFFPQLDVTSTPFIILSQFDFFQLWMFGILGLGLAHVFQVERKRGLLIAYLFWFLKSLLNIGVVYLSMRLFM
jgi:hypothetical protein